MCYCTNVAWRQQGSHNQELWCPLFWLWTTYLIMFVVSSAHGKKLDIDGKIDTQQCCQWDFHTFPQEVKIYIKNCDYNEDGLHNQTRGRWRFYLTSLGFKIEISIPNLKKGRKDEPLSSECGRQTTSALLQPFPSIGTELVWCKSWPRSSFNLSWTPHRDSLCPLEVLNTS